MLVQREAPAVAAGVPLTGQVKVLRGQGRNGGGGLGQSDGKLPPLALDEARVPLCLPHLAEEGQDGGVPGGGLPGGGDTPPWGGRKFALQRKGGFSRRTIL